MRNITFSLFNEIRAKKILYLWKLSLKAFLFTNNHKIS